MWHQGSLSLCRVHRGPDIRLGAYQNPTPNISQYTTHTHWEKELHPNFTSVRSPTPPRLGWAPAAFLAQDSVRGQSPVRLLFLEMRLRWAHSCIGGQLLTPALHSYVNWRAPLQIPWVSQLKRQGSHDFLAHAQDALVFSPNSGCPCPSPSSQRLLLDPENYP